MDLNNNDAVAVAEEVAAQPACDHEVVDMLTEIRDMTKKELIWQRVSSSALLVLVLALIIIGVNVIPKAVVAIQNVSEVAQVAIDSLHEIDVMVSDVTNTSQNVNKVIEDNAVPLSDAVNNMSNVDFDGLNKAIADLQDTVGPMASFFNKFR
ncbi:MAG: hypothetical protein K6C96_12345 [Butyrivibrio sp.]|nr:hypothetical protein [Butyrivibrio sp.]